MSKLETELNRRLGDPSRYGFAPHVNGRPARMIVHIAGEPEDGEQRCTRCGFPLRIATAAENDGWFYLPGALLHQINEAETVRFVAVRCRPTCPQRRSLRLARSAPAV